MSKIDTPARRDERVSVRLSIIDWQAVMMSLRRHADVSGHNSAATAVEVGRGRLRHIVATIESRIAGKVDQ